MSLIIVACGAVAGMLVIMLRYELDRPKMAITEDYHKWVQRCEERQQEHENRVAEVHRIMSTTQE